MKKESKVVYDTAFLLESEKKKCVINVSNVYHKDVRYLTYISADRRNPFADSDKKYIK